MTRTATYEPHRRLLVGKLSDGRRAFATAADCISALGDFPIVNVWVNDPEDSHGLALLRERHYVKRGTREYRQLFALILDGEERELNGCALEIAQELGWF